jgi:hypothetical protein
MTTREVGGIRLPTGLYRHIRSGGLYTVLGLVRHHETGHPMVIYYSHGHGTLSTRPLHPLATSRCSDPDGFEGRFEYLADASPAAAVVLWVSDTLLRNFALFDAALTGVGQGHARLDDDD